MYRKHFKNNNNPPKKKNYLIIQPVSRIVEVIQYALK